MGNHLRGNLSEVSTPFTPVMLPECCNSIQTYGMFESRTGGLSEQASHHREEEAKDRIDQGAGMA